MSKAFLFGVGGGVTPPGPQPVGDLSGLVDGTMVDFVMPAGITSLFQYRFYGMTSLVSADLRGAITVGINTFTNCTFLTKINLTGVNTISSTAFSGCTRLSDITWGNSLVNIQGNAFYSTGTTAGTLPYEFNSLIPCAIGASAFRSARISKILGFLLDVGDSAFQTTYLNEIDIECNNIANAAFQGCTSATIVKAKIKGSVANNSFYNIPLVANLDFSKSTISSFLGDSVFSQFGHNRPNASSNILTLDLRKSEFPGINKSTFAGTSSTILNKYMRFLFPKTVSVILNNSFYYTDGCNFYFSSIVPPFMYYSSIWYGSTNYKIFVPYNVISDYRAATNWAALISYMNGFSHEYTFAEGEKLPEFDFGGYKLSWYSDEAMTVPVTNVSNPALIYYCKAGTEVLAHRVVVDTSIGATVIISDGTKNYPTGSVISAGTVISITGVPNTQGHVPYIFKVNGENFVSGNQIAVTTPINIGVIYYDGITPPPSFASASWAFIRDMFRNGAAPYLWNLGDRKSITLTDSTTKTIRIVDMQKGRYRLADSSGFSNGVFDFLELFPTASAIRTTATTAGGWADSTTVMRTTTLPSLYELLPADLRTAISEVAINSGIGSSTDSPLVIAESKDKLFLAAVHELDPTGYGILAAEGRPQFGYFVGNKPALEKRITPTGGILDWWLRTANYGTTNVQWYYISDGRYFYQAAANTNKYVAPFFAI